MAARRMAGLWQDRKEGPARTLIRHVEGSGKMSGPYWT